MRKVVSFCDQVDFLQQEKIYRTPTAMGPRERMCLLLVQTTRCLLWWIVASTDIFRGFGNASGQHPVTSPGYVRKKSLNCLGSLLHILNRVGGRRNPSHNRPPCYVGDFHV
jgi:hypothetical protein